jgi:hypothetical protein
MGTNKKGRTSSLRHYFTIVLLSVALLIVPFGCAHRPEVKAPPLPKFTEAELGTVAVVSACFEPEFIRPYKPLTKGNAVGVGAVGSLKGLWGFILPASQGPYGAGGVLWGIALSPVFAAGGAIYGAAEGKTKETTREAEEALNHSLTTFRPQELMQERVLSLAQKNTRCTFVKPEQCGPNFLDEETTYDSLNGEGIDTVLEISVWRFGLWKEKGAINPPLSLCATVKTRLIRVKDGAVLSTRRFGYDSSEQQSVEWLSTHNFRYDTGKRKFTEWAKNNAQPFREELDRCFGGLAERILAELFIS